MKERKITPPNNIWRFTAANYIEASILIGLVLAFPVILYFGTSNGIGYFRQPQHDFFWPLINATLFNGLVFYLNSFLLVPRYFHKVLWRKYLLLIMILFVTTIFAKTFMEEIIISLNFPSLVSVSFFDLALENVYTFIAVLILSMGYGLARIAWKFQHQPNNFIDGRVYASVRENLNSDAFINLTSGEKVFRFLLKDIRYIEAQGNYVNMVCKGKSFLIYQSMQQIEKLLPKPLFLRVHRSFIISLQHFEIIDSHSVKVAEKTIPISQTYKKALKAILKKEINFV